MAVALENIHVRVEPELKKESIKVLNELGLSMSDFINMNLRRLVRDRKLDIEIDENDPLLPECMSLKTEEEIGAFLKGVFEEEDKKPVYYSDEEARAILGLK